MKKMLVGVPLAFAAVAPSKGCQLDLPPGMGAGAGLFFFTGHPRGGLTFFSDYVMVTLSFFRSLQQ